MNENLNLAEILKDCPRGTKLYLTIYGEVKLYKIDEDDKDYPIGVIHNGGKQIWLTSDGRFTEKLDGECILFPSKDQRDWEKFIPFKDGDVLSYKSAFLKNRTIYIYKYNRLMNTTYYVALSGDTDSTFRISNKVEQALNGYNSTARFATEEEKQKLFQAIKDNGYKWNAETKTLEKLVLNRFDPNTLKPFDKVLARMSNESYNTWYADFVAEPGYTEDETPLTIGAKEANMVIPYNEDTKHLVGTNEEAPEYYRYWED